MRDRLMSAEQFEAKGHTLLDKGKESFSRTNKICGPPPAGYEGTAGSAVFYASVMSLVHVAEESGVRPNLILIELSDVIKTILTPEGQI